MSELFTIAFLPICLPYTVSLGGLLGYWVLTAFGVFDSEMESEDVTPLLGVVQFGETPVLVGLTLMALFGWVLTAVTVHFFGSAPLVWLAHLPILMISYPLARTVGRPAGKLLGSLSRTNAAVKKIEAQLCVLLYDTDGESLSQAQIKTASAPVLVNVKARPGKQLAKGAEVLVVEKDPSGKFYYVESLED